jgi:ankyrin repeat protein
LQSGPTRERVLQVRIKKTKGGGMRTQEELNEELRLAVEGYARIAGGESEEIEDEDAVLLVERLLREGADPNARDPQDRSTLHVLAASRGSGGEMSEEASTRIGRLLLMAGADPNAESRHPIDRTILFTATSFASFLVPDLLAHGANPNAGNQYGETPLHCAAAGGLERTAGELIAAGANVDARARDGGAPLHRAALAGCLSVARLLIEKGADPGAASRDGLTPLHNALSDEVARLLLEKGADPCAASADGLTPLHKASGTGNADVARLLLEKGAHPNARENNGWTPLHLASSLEVARLLLDAGADPSAEDDCGVSTATLASHNGNEDVANLLRAVLEVRDMDKVARDPAPSATGGRRRGP